MQFTVRDKAVLRLLTHPLRAATADQLGRAVGCRGPYRRRLNELSTYGLVRRAAIVVERPVTVRRLVAVTRRHPTPNFDRLAWELENAWNGASSRRVTVYWGTSLAARLFGGRGGCLRQPFQLAHDLTVTDVFLSRIQLEPATRSRWVNEDALRRSHDLRGGVPDAVLINRRGEIHTAIEIGGRYPAARLRAFHRRCRRRRWAYEVWSP